MQALLHQDARHVRGDAEAEHRGLAGGELLRGAAGDDFLQAPVGQLEAVVGTQDLTADGRVVGGLRGLLLVGVHDHEVHQRSGHVHLQRLQRSGAHHALDLCDHDPTVVARGERLIERAEVCAFVLVGQVAAFVRGGGAQDRDPWRDGRVEQPLFAGEGDLLHEGLGLRSRVHRAALTVRVHEGVETDLGEHAGALRGGVAMHVEHDAARQIPRRDLVLADQAPDLRHRQRGRPAGVGAGQHLLQHAGTGEVIDAADAVHVARGDRVQSREVARVAFGGEACAERLQHLVGTAQAAGGADRDDVAVADQLRCLFGGDELAHAESILDHRGTEARETPLDRMHA